MVPKKPLTPQLSPCPGVRWERAGEGVGQLPSSGLALVGGLRSPLRPVRMPCWWRVSLVEYKQERGGTSQAKESDDVSLLSPPSSK